MSDQGYIGTKVDQAPDSTYTAPDTGGGGGDDGEATVASPYTIEQMPHPYGGDRMLNVIVFADPEAVVLAYAVAGDTRPRGVLFADPGDGWYMGDGTMDIGNDSGPNIFGAADSHELGLFGGFSGDDGAQVQMQNLRINGPGRVLSAVDVAFAAGTGPTLMDGGTELRLVAHDDGTVTCEPVNPDPG